LTRHGVMARLRAIARLHHDGIVQKIKEGFQAKEYRVYDGLAPIKYIPELKERLNKDKVDEYFNQKGKDHFPDLVAIKGKEVVFIEVKDRSERFVRQIANYSKLATKTVLVVEADTSNMEVKSWLT